MIRDRISMQGMTHPLEHEGPTRYPCSLSVSPRRAYIVAKLAAGQKIALTIQGIEGASRDFAELLLPWDVSGASDGSGTVEGRIGAGRRRASTLEKHFRVTGNRHCSRAVDRRWSSV
jgi:hypothetical protein